MNDLTVVIPVLNEDPKTVYDLYQNLTLSGAEVIVVEDGGNTEYLCPTVGYPANMGYGYAIKYGISKSTRPTVLVCDGDGQHTFSDAQKLYTVFKLGEDFEMVVGQRYNLVEKPIRWFARKCLNFLASLIAGHYLVDLNSGMRIFRKDLALGYKDILCDTFSFTTSFSMAVVTDKHKIMYFPINVQQRKFGKSRVKLFRDGLITLYYIIWVGMALRTRRIRACIRGLLT